MEWDLTTKSEFAGTIFTTTHIMLILMSTMQVEKVFLGIPKKMGYFDIQKHMNNEIKDVVFDSDG